MKQGVQLGMVWLLSLLAAACGGNHRAYPVPLANRHHSFTKWIHEREQVFANPKLTPATLQFDAEGKLINIMEFSRLVQTIKAANSSANTNDHYQRIVVLSMGWGHSVDEFQEDYSDVLAHYLQYLETQKHSVSNRWLVLCVAWPSGRDSLSHGFKSVLPSRVAAQLVGKPLDLAMLPFTVWASAGLADAIGYGELSDSLQYLYETSFETNSYPAIYMVGHSFGCRVLAGAVSSTSRVPERLDRMFRGRKDVREFKDQVYTYRTNIAAGLFIQPAMSTAEVERFRDVRLLVTQSRHDHLNGGVFPIANVPYNFSSGPIFEALMEQAEFELWNKPSVFGAANSAAVSNFVAKGYYRTANEFLAFGMTPAYSAGALVLTPFSSIPLNSQGTNNCLILNTVAQAPVLEVPLKSVRPGLSYGKRSKGLLSLGRYYESGARLGSRDRKRVDIEEIQGLDPTSVTNGVTYVEASSVIKHGALFNEWLSDRRVDATIGWIDPIGSHMDWEQAPVFGLMEWVLSLPVR